MGYACYERNGRDQDYGVPAKCDHPGCDADIDRGIAYACGGEPTENCGLFFCGKHLSHRIINEDTPDEEWTPALCERCHDEDAAPFDPSPDTQEWIDHKMIDPTWDLWRSENPEFIAANMASLEQPKEPPHER